MQRVYLPVAHRETLIRWSWYLRLGNKVIVIMSGMAGETEPRCGLESDGFCLLKTMRNSGVCKYTLSSVVHKAISDVYADIQNCPGLLEYTEPVVFNFLVYEQWDTMHFTITSTCPDDVMTWIQSKNDDRIRVTHEYLMEDVTTEDDKRRQLAQYVTKRVGDIRKLVALGLLEPFE